MEEKRLTEYKPSVISKIKNFFRKMFSKSNNDIEEKTVETVNNNQENNSFIAEIQSKNSNDISTSNTTEKNDFLKEIDGNREMLEMLSVERLKKLSEYYDVVINQNELKIKKLKAS